jgi:hypothetical protein
MYVVIAFCVPLLTGFIANADILLRGAGGKPGGGGGPYSPLAGEVRTGRGSWAGAAAKSS